MFISKNVGTTLKLKQTNLTTELGFVGFQNWLCHQHLLFEFLAINHNLMKVVSFIFDLELFQVLDHLFETRIGSSKPRRFQCLKISSTSLRRWRKKTSNKCNSLTFETLTRSWPFEGHYGNQSSLLGLLLFFVIGRGLRCLEGNLIASSPVSLPSNWSSFGWKRLFGFIIQTSKRQTKAVSGRQKLVPSLIYRVTHKYLLVRLPQFVTSLAKSHYNQ